MCTNNVQLEQRASTVNMETLFSFPELGNDNSRLRAGHVRCAWRVNWDFTGAWQKFLAASADWLFLLPCWGKQQVLGSFNLPQRLFFLGAEYMGCIFALPVLSEDYLDNFYCADIP